MTMRLLALSLAFLLTGAAQNDAAKKDLESIQGTWVMEALEVNGMDVAAEKLNGAVLTIKGDRYELKLKDKVINVFTLKLHPGKSPKELDMTAQEGANKDKVHRGIYKIENGKFIFARGLEPEQDRPTEFATWPGTNCFVVTWKKQ
jgi:uncharacterized protein (TIGR03067 family)